MHKPAENCVGDVSNLQLGTFFAAIRSENIAFVFLCFYILVEYIRPQNMYPILDFLPWGQFALGGCLICIIFTGSKAIGFGAMDKMFASITFLVLVSVIFAWSSSVSLRYWSTFVSWVLMFFCVVSVITTPRRMLLFIIFFLLINFKMSQHGTRTFALRGFSFSHWGLSGAPGWFHNSGELALQMVVVLAIGICLLIGLKEHIESRKRWWFLLLLFPGTAFLTILGSSSRGGQLAMLCVIVFLMLSGRKLFRNLMLMAMMAVVTMVLMPDEQMERFDLAGNDQTSVQRLTLWKHAREVFREHPWGIGYQNWADYYAMNYDVEKVEQIHNTPLQAFVELGILGGSIFHIAIIMALVMNRRTRHDMIKIGGKDGDAMAAIARGINMSLLGTFVAAFFMSVLYYPMYWLAFALTSSLRHIARDMRKRSEPIPGVHVSGSATMLKSSIAHR